MPHLRTMPFPACMIKNKTYNARSDSPSPNQAAALMLPDSAYEKARLRLVPEPGHT